VIAADASEKISDVVAKQAIRKIFETGESGKLTELKSDEGELESVIIDILKEKPELLEEIRKQPKAINHLIGSVIKKTEGRFDSKKVGEAVRKEIEKRKLQ